MNPRTKRLASPRKLLSLVGLLSLVAMPWACSDDTVIASAGSDVTARVTDVGAEPRRELRLVVQEGQREIMVMLMNMQMAMRFDGTAVPGIEAPAMEMRMEFEITEVSSTGSARQELRKVSAKAIAGEGVPDELVEQVNTAIQPMTGMVGWTVISNRGIPEEFSITIPGDVTPQITQMLQQMEQSFSQLCVPLPEEPVGIGARWETTTSMNAGMEVQVTYRTHLVELDGEGARFEVEIEQHAAPQPFAAPGMPAGVDAMLNSFSSSGSGRTSVRFDKLMPIEGEMELDGTMDAAMRTAGEETRFEMDIGVKLSTRSEWVGPVSSTAPR